MSKKIDIDDVTNAAARVLDDYLAKHWPDVRFSLHVWRHDNPALPTGAGVVGFTTNDVPNAQRVALDMAVNVLGMDDPNAAPKKMN